VSNRANATNSLGIGVTQTQAGNVTPINTWVTTFPRPAGGTILVTRAAQGASVNDNVERDSDGGLWDTTAGVNVAPENTNIGINDMLSN
jgi:hypothetical protein